MTTRTVPPRPAQTRTLRHGRKVVAVVHGHRHREHGSISMECARRVEKAATLHVDAVLLSGGAGKVAWATEAIQMATIYQGAGTVYLDTESRDTVDNMHNGLRWAHEQNAQSVLLVTSWWHIPRVRLHWRGDHGPLRVQFVASRGSLRYVPAELRALLRAWWRR
jgi:hypothetical protein